MNITRRIQLGATATIVNAALALTLMSPQPAAAAACDPFFIQCYDVVCGEPEWDCQYFAPTGCVLTASYCLDSCGSWVGLYCVYAPA